MIWQYQRHIKIRNVFHSCPQQNAQQNNVNYHGDKRTLTNTDQLLPFKDRLWESASVFQKFSDSDLIHTLKYLKIPPPPLKSTENGFCLGDIVKINLLSLLFNGYPFLFYFISILWFDVFIFSASIFVFFAMVFLDITFQNAWIICDFFSLRSGFQKWREDF